jgi:hypothetical protein
MSSLKKYSIQDLETVRRIINAELAERTATEKTEVITNPDTVRPDYSSESVRQTAVLVFKAA